MIMVYLCWYKCQDGYLDKYIAMDFGRYLVLIFIRTFGMIVWYDYLDCGLIYGILKIVHVYVHKLKINNIGIDVLI